MKLIFLVNAENDKSIILDELNVKSIERITNAGSLVSYNIKPNLPILGKKYSGGLKTIIEILNSVDNDELMKQLELNESINLEKNNESFTLLREDIFIETVAAEGFSAVSGGGITVGLTLELNDELIQEGIVRDLVRQVQNIRKDAGFSVEDRINISWELDSEFEDAISKFREYFCNETLTVSFSEKNNDRGYNTDFNLRNRKIKLFISKTND